MADESLDWDLDSDSDEPQLEHETYSTRFTVSSRRRSSTIPGATEQSAIYSTSRIVLHDTIIAFLSYVKTFNIPILPVTKPDIRTVLGQGVSFLVNGAEVPKNYVDPATGTSFKQGKMVAMKRARLKQYMKRPIADRIAVIYNELLTMMHQPLAAHPNIVNLLGVGFETEGPTHEQRSTPVLLTEIAELGNLADVLETARKEERPMLFEDKLELCRDVAHGLEILHACDIVHGDIKCENVLVFERDDSRKSSGAFKLHYKLTDFGALQLPSGDIALGGSRPWQAPEITREAAFKVQDAKRTDVYGLGMLVWRTVLDGDPFQSLGTFSGATTTERRQKRNDAIAKLKQADTLVDHVCESLAYSGKFTKPQLSMLCDVIRVTLPNHASDRETNISRIIRMLSFDGWYQERHPVTPSRMAADVHIDLIDMEKWYSEFESVSPVVQADILKGFEAYALSSIGVVQSRDETEKKSAAAYQLAICCANGFANKFQPIECLRWLSHAAQQGSQKAQRAFVSFEDAFPDETPAFRTSFKDPFSSQENKDIPTPSDAWTASQSQEQDSTIYNAELAPAADAQSSWLAAAQSGNLTALKSLLDGKAKLSASADGVTALHFLSSWDPSKAEDLGRRLVAAGADINAVAERGASVGGTPLMWSVHGDHQEHSQILLRLGAEPMKRDNSGESAVVFAAKLHLAAHIRILMEHVRPFEIRGTIGMLLEAAAGGESRFTRIMRHGSDWRTAALHTLELLQDWNRCFQDTVDFSTLIVPAVERGAASAFGRVNTDVQVAFIEKAAVKPADLTKLLRQSILEFNVDLMDAVLHFSVPLDSTFEHGRSVLHLCAKIPDHSLAATAFAPGLLSLGAILDGKDENGITPWMYAILERKWDLADLYLKHGANPLESDTDGFNIVGLCTKTVNLGALKFLLKYTGDKTFKNQFFMVNQGKQISSLQLASSLTLPREHGMKVEVTGTFLTILHNLAQETSQIDFKSNGISPSATALDIAASRGVVHAVRHLVKRGAALPSDERVLGWTQAKPAKSEDLMQRKNVERCIYIIENYGRDPEGTMKLAGDWTNLKTIDESKVESSWENVCWDYANRINLA